MPPTREIPVWRSLLFVPANVEKFVAKAPSVGPDGVILDLEDAVAASQKASARALVPDVAARLTAAGLDVTVRINRPWRLAVRDLETAVCEPVAALVLPMTDSAQHVREVARVVGEIEAEKGLAPGHTRLMPIIETAEGYLNAREIAAADPRIVSLSLGSEDFGLSMGMTADAETLYGPKQHIVACARAAGINPMGFVGSIADYRDVERFRGIVRRSKHMGLRGASCIHPNQVMVCNEEFGPTDEEVASARRIVEGYDAALARGEGAITVDGKFVDVPVAERAKAVIALAEAIEARVARRRAAAG